MNKKDKLEKKKAVTNQNDALSDERMFVFMKNMLGNAPFAKAIASYLLIEDDDLIVELSQIFPDLDNVTSEDIIYFLSTKHDEISFPDETSDLATQSRQCNRMIDLFLNRCSIEQFVDWGRAHIDNYIHQPHNRELFDLLFSSDSSDSLIPDLSDIGKESVLRDVELLIEKLWSMSYKKTGRCHLQKDFLSSFDRRVTMMIFLLIFRELHLLKIAASKGSNDQAVWGKTFKIGMLIGLAFQPKLLSKFKNMLSSVSNSEAVSDGRWKVTNELLAEAVKIADEKWKNKCPLLHDDMAKVLHKKIKCPENKEKDFSEDRIMGAIKSVAPANKIRGMKDAKKKYNYKNAEKIYSKH